MDRSQQIKQKQTRLCFRQKINSSRINNKELIKHQHDDNILSKTLNKETDDASCCSINTVHVASNNQQVQIYKLSEDLSRNTQKDFKDSLIQKNKILLNKYKLIRRISSSVAAPSAKIINNVFSTKGKEGISQKLIVHSGNGGPETAKRIVKLKMPFSPHKKIKQVGQISSNFYRKINNVLAKTTNEK